MIARRQGCLESPCSGEPHAFLARGVFSLPQERIGRCSHIERTEGGTS